jgi:hypothetical protein
MTGILCFPRLLMTRCIRYELDLMKSGICFMFFHVHFIQHCFTYRPPLVPLCWKIYVFYILSMRRWSGTVSRMEIYLYFVHICTGHAQNEIGDCCPDGNSVHSLPSMRRCSAERDWFPWWKFCAFHSEHAHNEIGDCCPDGNSMHSLLSMRRCSAEQDWFPWWKFY